MLEALNKLSGTNKLLLGFLLVVAVIILITVVPGVIPKSPEGKYDRDRFNIARGANVYIAGYPPGVARTRVSHIELGVHPTYALKNSGVSESLKASDVGNDAITTLGSAETNPTAGKEYAGIPSWDDNGDGKRAAGKLPLYHVNASPAPAVDHWNTTVVTVKDVEYVVDSRDWFLDLDLLVSKGYLDAVPESASPDNSATGTGSYSWYVDPAGDIKSMLYSFPKPETDGFKHVYP